MKKGFFALLVLLSSIMIVGCGPTTEDLNCTPPEVEEDGVCVTTDTTDPSIEGVHNINYMIGDDTPDYLNGISATDDVDGDLTDAITVDTTLVDLTTEGEYTITFTVLDAAGNETTETCTIMVAEVPLTEAELAALDIAAISIPQTIAVPNEVLILDLPNYGRNGTAFTWTTSHPDVIALSGFVSNPTLGNDDVVVTLSASVTNGNHEDDISFDVTVESYQEVVVTQTDSVRFTNLTNQYHPDDQPAVEIHFVDDGAVPYIDIETYVNMLDKVFDADAITFTPIDSDKLELRYEPILSNYFLFYTEPVSVGQQYQTLLDQSIDPPVIEEVTALFDFTENTVTFSSYLFFTKLVTVKNPEESLGISVVDVDVDYGDPFTISLSEYNIDILIYNDGIDNQYLVPYHLIEMMFTSSSWYSTFYKPGHIMGQEVSWNIDATELVESDVNGDDIPLDIRITSYNLFVLSLDYFSSRKGYDEVESYHSYLADKREMIISAANTYYYLNYANVLREIDDLKAIVTMKGYYANNPASTLYVTEPYGPRVEKLNTAYSELYTQMSTKYGSLNIPSNKPTLRLLDDDKTAVIHFYEFNRSVPDQFKERLDLLPDSIENVVIDVSLNMGGNVGAVLRMFGYMTDEVTRFHMVNPATNSRMTYYVDNDLPTYNYNWYFLVSGASFNAGTVVAGAAMENGVATLIGQRGYGSTSTGDVISLPCGLIYTLLSNNSFYGRTGNEVDGYDYAPLQFGVDVEYPVADIVSDQQVIDAINQHQSDTAN